MTSHYAPEKMTATLNSMLPWAQYGGYGERRVISTYTQAFHDSGTELKKGSQLSWPGKGQQVVKAIPDYFIMDCRSGALTGMCEVKTSKLDPSTAPLGSGMLLQPSITASEIIDAYKPTYIRHLFSKQCPKTRGKHILSPDLRDAMIQVGNTAQWTLVFEGKVQSVESGDAKYIKLDSTPIGRQIMREMMVMPSTEQGEVLGCLALPSLVEEVGELREIFCLFLTFRMRCATLDGCRDDYSKKRKLQSGPASSQEDTKRRKTESDEQSRPTQTSY